LTLQTITDARNKILAGACTLSELVEEYFSVIEEKNADLNAFVYLNKADALQQAEAIQAKIEQGTHGRLMGAIMGIKDVICEKGKPTTCASEILGDFHSVYDATVIERLRAEDAIFIGRLNMDEFAMGSTNEYSRYGVAKNPHDLTKVPGGSSGGSAVAVAADMANATLGSDTGGSIRQPASYCGVVGLKPTYGRVSRYGLVAYASSFDSIGPLAHSVEDAARIFSVIAGFDERDNTSSQEPVADVLAAVQNPTKKIKIGVPEEFFGEGLDPEIKKMVEDMLQKLEADGAELVPIHLDHTKYGLATYYILATAEASSNLARFDGIRYGHRAEKNVVMEELKTEEVALKEAIKHAEGSKVIELENELSRLDSPLTRLYKKSRTEGFGAEVKRRIMLGTYVLSSGYYDAYYAKAQKVRRLIKEDYTKAFREVDVIVSPTAPTTAFDIGAKLDDPIQMYLNDAYTISANLAGICGISVPLGKHSNGLPVGIQFMGDTFKEDKILNAARLVELQS
jgi:aspartyl-tRNA(Asn)/glutamyl-tRNA(Gln) amidotransferase subunit A